MKFGAKIEKCSFRLIKNYLGINFILSLIKIKSLKTQNNTTLTISDKYEINFFKNLFSYNFFS
jgi:hypothetical protein